MSKRLFTQEKWKTNSRRRQRRELSKTRRRHQLRTTGRGALVRSQRQARRKRRFSTIEAPKVFSLIDNPEETIRFFHEIEAISAHNNVSLDLEGTESLSTDAVAAFVATIRKPDIWSQTGIRGNQPAADGPRKMLIESGFFSHVKSEQPIASVKGKISERNSKKVEPGTARDLIHLAMKVLFGTPQRSQPAYRALIECMNNTHNHASRRLDHRETWWATAYADVARGRACFTFVDTGVGIFKSVHVGAISKLLKFTGIETDADLLRDLLEGKIESSTGEPFRGKGLPAIYRLCQAGALKVLVIIANDVYARVETANYRQMDTSFKGTLLYWEV